MAASGSLLVRIKISRHSSSLQRREGRWVRPFHQWLPWQGLVRTRKNVLSQAEVGSEGHVVLALPGGQLGKLLQRVGVPRAGGQEHHPGVVLGVVQALQGQPKLTLGDG